ncbi:MAG: PEGA domain-containing protein [Methanomicrobiaceae archaeon]|nr:PEGA domain-containing protein [Methanomicrobiaceae archaeon]
MKSACRHAVLISVLLCLGIFTAATGCLEDEPSSQSYSTGYGQPGAISLWTTPGGASIYLNGEYLGETGYYEASQISVPAGSYKLEVFKTGYEAYLEYVYVGGGETVYLDVYLQETGGSAPYAPVTPEPEPVWTWEPEPSYPGPTYGAATRPVYN